MGRSETQRCESSAAFAGSRIKLSQNESTDAAMPCSGLELGAAGWELETLA